MANADLILYLHQGAIVESGSHEELLARRGHYWGLWNHQRTTSSGLSSSNRTSKVDLVALEREKEKEEEVEKVEKINIVEREFRV